MKQKNKTKARRCKECNKEIEKNKKTRTTLLCNKHYNKYFRKYMKKYTKTKKYQELQRKRKERNKMIEVLANILKRQLEKEKVINNEDLQKMPQIRTKNRRQHMRNMQTKKHKKKLKRR